MHLSSVWTVKQFLQIPNAVTSGMQNPDVVCTFAFCKAKSVVVAAAKLRLQSPAANNQNDPPNKNYEYKNTITYLVSFT